MRSTFFLSLLLITVLTNLANAEKIVLVAGGGEAADGGPAKDAKLAAPFAIAFDSAGNIYLAEYNGQRIRRIDGNGLITTIAGNGDKGFAGDGGPALQCKFNNPHSLTIGPGDELLVADTANRRVRRVDPQSGRITIYAGTGNKGFSGDFGPAVQADFGAIYCIAFDRDRDRLYLDDLDNRRIRMLFRKTGVITTVAGNGEKGVPRDGSDATQSPLVDPRAVAVDREGNVYILERNGNALRMVDRQGKIRTVVGTGEKGSSGDGGPALQARLSGPKHLCCDADGNVLIADTDNHAIRKYSPSTGQITRVAGSGQKGTAGLGGDPKQVELNEPHGVAIDSSGTLYIADSMNNRVLKIVP